MPTDKSSHQLYKQVGHSLLTVGASPGESTATNGWDVISSGSISYFVHRTYIDLAGWTRQDLTTFTRGVDIQKGIMPLLGGVEAATGIREFDILSTRRLTDTECQVYLDIPGYHPSTVDLMQIIYGEFVEYARNGTIANTFIKTNTETFGSGNPTAMDKLHWTRIYYLHVPQAGDQIIVDNTNLVVQAITAKEREYVWMERLRRSYVLQGEI